MPKKLDLLFLPVLINNEENELIYFGENPIYNNWENYKKKHHLLNYILMNFENAEGAKNTEDLLNDFVLSRDSAKIFEIDNRHYFNPEMRSKCETAVDLTLRNIKTNSKNSFLPIKVNFIGTPSVTN